MPAYYENNNTQVRSSLLTIIAVTMLSLGCGSDQDRPVEQPAQDGAVTDVGPDVQVDAGVDGAADTSSDVQDASSDSAADAGSTLGPSKDFDRYCQAPWKTSLQDAKVGELNGEYQGAYDKLPAGTLLTMKEIPSQPFWVKTIRVAFARGQGKARIRLMKTFGRSYPDLDSPNGDLLAPIEVQVSDAKPNKWYEIDVSSAQVMLEPTQHYMLVYEMLGEEPQLAVESLPPGERSRALMLIPGEKVPYGSKGNFRMELCGSTFCTWSQSRRWFEAKSAQPFSEAKAQYAAFADVNGDGHDDLVVNERGPQTFFGDGNGGFQAAATNPFQAVAHHTMLVFADIDNDGDEDVFAATNVSPDRDGDGVKMTDGDCDDANKDVHPGAKEVAGNGLDDDCDGTVDDGLSTADEDGDGVTVKDGDCNDKRDDVHPGAEELLDGRDNDCNGQADDGLVNRILLNDGAGGFAVVSSAGVERMDPTAAAAFGDADGDGKLDLYWGNWLVHYPNAPAVKDVFMTGRGDGVFEDKTVAAGMTKPGKACYGVRWADYNNDGLPDIWVGNYGYGDNALWRNRGDGTFVDVAFGVGAARDKVGMQGGNTFGGDWGDIDNDGDLDLYAANIAHPRYQPDSDPSRLLINHGATSGYNFSGERAARGLVYDEGDVNASFADFDNDGDLDLAVASLYPGHMSRLYANDGTGHFTDVSFETGVAVEDAVSVVWSDVDEDGDLDLVTADRSGKERVHLFINRVGQDKHWIELRLQGVSSNRDAIGARVSLTSGGLTQLREVSGGGGHSNNQSTKVVHFGLGDSAAIKSLQVRWPGGAVETIVGAQVDHRYVVVQGTGKVVEK